MLTNEEFNGTIQHLTGPEIGLRVGALKDLWQYPSADPRVLPYLEERLNDKTPCILGYPYIFGEIRWLAAKALAAERAALGINQPVQVRVVRPAETRDIILAEYEAGISGRGGVEGLLESLALARDMGYMPMIDLELWPLGKPSVVAQKAVHLPELVTA